MQTSFDSGTLRQARQLYDEITPVHARLEAALAAGGQLRGWDFEFVHADDLGSAIAASKLLSRNSRAGLELERMAEIVYKLRMAILVDDWASIESDVPALEEFCRQRPSGTSPCTAELGHIRDKLYQLAQARQCLAELEKATNDVDETALRSGLETARDLQAAAKFGQSAQWQPLGARVGSAQALLLRLEQVKSSIVLNLERVDLARLERDLKAATEMRYRPHEAQVASVLREKVLLAHQALKEALENDRLLTWEFHVAELGKLDNALGASLRLERDSLDGRRLAEEAQLVANLRRALRAVDWKEVTHVVQIAERARVENDEISAARQRLHYRDAVNECLRELRRALARTDYDRLSFGVDRATELGMFNRDDEWRWKDLRIASDSDPDLLLAAQRRVEDITVVKVGLRQMMSAPSIEGLSQAVQKVRRLQDALVLRLLAP